MDEENKTLIIDSATLSKKNQFIFLFLNLLVVLISVIAVLGWYFEINTFITVFPNFAPMQVNTAFCFIISAVGVFFQKQKVRSLAVALGMFLILIAGSTFLQYVFLIDLNIDTLLVDSNTNMNLVSDPGRMSPMTAVSFVLIALILVFGSYKKVVLSFIIALSLICSLTMLSYFLGLKHIQGLGNFSRMAVHTNGCFILLLLSLYISHKFHRAKRVNFWRLSPVLILVVCGVITVLTWGNFSESLKYQNQRYFESIVENKKNEIFKRFTMYEHALLSGKGFIKGSSQVTRKEWQAYVDSLDIKHYLPGSNGIGFIDYIKQKDLKNYVGKIRQQDFLDFKVHPKTDHEDKFIIKYIEPENLNLPAIGLDIGFEKNRRDAAELSRDTGKTFLTKKIYLVQDSMKQAGFLLLAPVYKGAKDTHTSDQERKKNFLGWVYSPFMARNFISDIANNKQSEITLSIYEGDELNQKNFIYSDRDFVEANKKFKYLNKVESIVLGQRNWTLQWQPSKNFIGKVDARAPRIVFFIGLLASILLSGMFYLLSQLYGESEKVAGEAKLQLKSLFDQSLDAILTFKANGKILSINNAGEAMFEINKNNKSRSESIFEFIPKLKDLMQQLPEYSETKKNNFELEAQTKNKRKLTIEGVVSPIRIRESFTFSLILRDITDRKKIETLKNEFISTVNHELRTPLTAITGSLAVIKMKLKDKVDDQIKSLMELSSRNCKKLASLVNDLLDMEKIAAGKMAYDMNSHDINILTQKAVEDNNGFALKHQVNLIYKKNEVPLIIHVDSLRYQQAATNLISNAIKFSPKGEDVLVTVYEKNGFAELCVKDKGPGIPKTYEKKIFDKFSQVDGSSKRKEGGTGLGLNITQAIVEKFGGRIFYKTVLGQGSSFFIQLPMEE